MTRSEVTFTADGNVELGAWLYLPKGEASRNPAITGGDDWSFGNGEASLVKS